MAGLLSKSAPTKGKGLLSLVGGEGGLMEYLRQLHEAEMVRQFQMDPSHAYGNIQPLGPVPSQVPLEGGPVYRQDFSESSDAPPQATRRAMTARQWQQLLGQALQNPVGTF